MRLLTTLTSIFLLLTVQIAFAQTGIISGRVTNKINNEPVAFATLMVEGTTNGANSDENGNYEITELVPGLYNVKASFVGFNEVTIYEIQVTNSKPAEVNIEMEASSQQLEEVVVRTSPFKKTEESPVSLRTIGVAEIQRNPGRIGTFLKWCSLCPV